MIAIHHISIVFMCFILIGTSNGQSVYDKVRYEPLNQDPADNEEEDDDVVFVQDGAKQNGFKQATDIQELKDSMREDIEVGDLGLQKAKVSRKKPASDVEVKVLKHGVLTRTRILCFVFTLVACVAAILAFIFIVPYLNKPKIPIVQYNQTKSWITKFDDIGKVLISIFLLLVHLVDYKSS